MLQNFQSIKKVVLEEVIFLIEENINTYFSCGNVIQQKVNGKVTKVEIGKFEMGHDKVARDKIQNYFRTKGTFK